MKTVAAADTRLEPVPVRKRVPGTNERIHEIVMYISIIFILGSVSLFYLIYGGILAAYHIGDLCQMNWLGYPVVLIAYTLLGAAIWRNRKHLLRVPFFGEMIRKIFAE